MTLDRVIQMSGGKGSWYTGVRVAETRVQPGDRLVMLFSDTKTEDEDLYRFLNESAADIIRRLPEGATGELVKLADGRDVWDVFDDVKYIGNTRLDPCSRILKRQLIRRWMDQNLDPEKCIVYLGIDWTEAHRFEKAIPYWKPWTVEAPLCEPPYIAGDTIVKELEAAGIEVPRLYKLGFVHNNCGGFCVKAGQAQFKLLLEKRPEVYAYHEERERQWRERNGKDVAVMRDRRGGTTKPMTMEAFRKRVQADQIQVDPDDIGGCACFTPNSYEEDET